MFLKRLKIVHKILVVIICGIMISIIFAGTAIFIGKNDTKTLESIYMDNVTPLDSLRRIQLIVRELEGRMTGVQADVIAPIGSAPHLEQSIQDIDAEWITVKNSLADYELSDESLEAIQSFEKGYKGYKDNIVPPLNKAYLNSDTDSVSDLYDEWLDYKPLIMKSIDSFAEMLKEAVKESYLKSRATTSFINTFITIVAAVSISFFTVFALFIVRSIKKPITTVVKSAEKVANGDLTQSIDINSFDEMGIMAARINRMIEHLGGAFDKIVIAIEDMSADTTGLSELSDKLLRGAKDQRNKGEQIAVASTQMSQTIVDMAKDTTDASEATRESNDTAASGKEIVNRTVDSITRLASSVEEASNTIEGLGVRANEIGEIVSVIQDIASQTNLLALNAAIEAARSGEHGRGFAVVADEVKKLAERTAHSTDEISAKIAAIQDESKISISTMEKGRVLAEESVNNASGAGEALQKIVESSNKVMDMVQRVSAATEEQSAAAEEVSHNMEYISSVINDHFSMAEAVQKSALHLTDLAQGVIDQTAFFKTKRIIGTSDNLQQAITGGEVEENPRST